MEGMLYMSSTCSSDGSYRLTVTFEVGTDLDKAQVLVQNRLAVAQPRLPQEVQRQGVTAQEAIDELHHGGRPDLARPPVRRPVPGQLRHAPGQGRAEPDLRGRRLSSLRRSKYGMRIWLDPEKLKARDLTTEDVLAAIREQNVQVAAGQVGQYPSPEAQGFQYNVTTLGRLSDPEQFGDIIVKADDSRRRPTTRQGGPASLGSGTWPASSWARRSTTSGARSVASPPPALAVFLLPGANRWPSPGTSGRPWRS